LVSKDISGSGYRVEGEQGAGEQAVLVNWLIRSPLPAFAGTGWGGMTEISPENQSNLQVVVDKNRKI